MKITTQSQAITMGNRVRASILKRVTTTLARFDHMIERVDVYLKDINGPKGGADKQVTLVVWLDGGGPAWFNDRTIMGVAFGVFHIGYAACVKFFPSHRA